MLRRNGYWEITQSHSQVWCFSERLASPAPREGVWGEKVQWFLMKNINQGALPVGMATVSVCVLEPKCVFWACILWILGHRSVLLDFLTPFSTVSQLAYSHQPASVQPDGADWIPALRSHSAEILLDLPEQCILVKASISLFLSLFLECHAQWYHNRGRGIILAQPHYSLCLLAQKNVLNAGCFPVCSMLRGEKEAFSIRHVAGGTSCALNSLIFLLRWITSIEGMVRNTIYPTPSSVLCSRSRHRGLCQYSFFHSHNSPWVSQGDLDSMPIQWKPIVAMCSDATLVNDHCVAINPPVSSFDNDQLCCTLNNHKYH